MRRSGRSTVVGPIGTVGIPCTAIGAVAASPDDWSAAFTTHGHGDGGAPTGEDRGERAARADTGDGLVGDIAVGRAAQAAPARTTRPGPWSPPASRRR